VRGGILGSLADKRKDLKKNSGRACKPDSPVDIADTQLVLNQSVLHVNSVNSASVGRFCVTPASQIINQITKLEKHLNALQMCELPKYVLHCPTIESESLCARKFRRW
jgi:hypothetical protein